MDLKASLLEEPPRKGHPGKAARVAARGRGEEMGIDMGTDGGLWGRQGGVRGFEKHRANQQ